MVVPFFRPELIKVAERNKLERADLFLKNNFGDYTFTSSGRASIYYILTQHQLNGSLVGTPVYACKSITDAIERSGNTPFFIDIDHEDLNISFDSFRELALNNNLKAVIVPSLYGNPAQLDRFEEFCRDHHILMIDDAAQSFGASLKGRLAGTYGDAGFFSAAPGKCLSGFMGSICVNKKAPPPSPHRFHPIFQYLKFLSFCLNRVRNKSNECNKASFAGRIVANLVGLVSRFADLYNEIPGNFVRNYFLSLVDHFNSGGFSYREEYWNLFNDQLSHCDLFRILRSRKGNPVFIKIVLIFHDPQEALLFRSFLETNNIAFIPGYRFWSDQYDSSIVLKDKIVELPIDPDQKVNAYMMEKINEYVTNHRSKSRE